MTYYETVRDYFVRNEINHRVKDYSKSKGYERLDDVTKLKLIEKEKLELPDTIKNPVIIPNTNIISKEFVLTGSEEYV